MPNKLVFILKDTEDSEPYGDDWYYHKVTKGRTFDDIYYDIPVEGHFNSYRYNPTFCESCKRSTKSATEDKEYGTPIEGLIVLEVSTEYIPDYLYNPDPLPGVGKTRFLTITTYTECQYYSKTTSLENILTYKSTDKSVCTRDTDSTDSISVKVARPEVPRTVVVSTIPIQLYHEGYNAESTTSYTERNTDSESDYSTDKEGYYAEVPRQDQVDQFKVITSTTWTSTCFIFPRTVYKYCNDRYTIKKRSKKFNQGAGYRYFLSTLQYCFDTCTKKELSEWVAVLYSNRTCRDWIRTLNDIRQVTYNQLCYYPEAFLQERIGSLLEVPEREFIFSIS